MDNALFGRKLEPRRSLGIALVDTNTFVEEVCQRCLRESMTIVCSKSKPLESPGVVAQNSETVSVVQSKTVSTFVTT